MQDINHRRCIATTSTLRTRQQDGRPPQRPPQRPLAFALMNVLEMTRAVMARNCDHPRGGKRLGTPLKHSCSPVLLMLSFLQLLMATVAVAPTQICPSQTSFASLLPLVLTHFYV